VIIQIIVLSGMLPMGMGVATSIRVGHYLGQEKAEAAKRAATSGTVLFCIGQNKNKCRDQQHKQWAGALGSQSACTEGVHAMPAASV
jgi:hypothetical protein